MAANGPCVLILGSGPDVLAARDWPRGWFDVVVAINNAWAVRPDWDYVIFPEDFPPDRHPVDVGEGQSLVEADAFVPAQNRFGGFVYAGATMAYTAGYWALDALRPSVMAFAGCNMIYDQPGETHFYGSGRADPLRKDVSLRDLGAKASRLGVLAAQAGSACVRLGGARSSLTFPLCPPAEARAAHPSAQSGEDIRALRGLEDALGYLTPDGRHDATGAQMDIAALDAIDAGWRALYAGRDGAQRVQ